MPLFDAINSKRSTTLFTGYLLPQTMRSCDDGRLHSDRCRSLGRGASAAWRWRARMRRGSGMSWACSRSWTHRDPTPGPPLRPRCAMACRRAWCATVGRLLTFCTARCGVSDTKHGCIRFGWTVQGLLLCCQLCDSIESMRMGLPGICLSSHGEVAFLMRGTKLI